MSVEPLALRWECWDKAVYTAECVQLTPHLISGEKAIKMFKRLTVSIGSGVLMVAGLFAPVAHGQDNLPLKHHAYFIAEDEAGIDQVWRVLAETGETTPLTQASADVVSFAVPHDALSVYYASESALWMQSTDGAEPLAESVQIADLASDDFHTSLVFSQDDAVLAYNDNGIHLFDLATQTSTQVLANGAPDKTTGFAVSYEPLHFIDSTHLIVAVHEWEWLNAGVLNLETGAVSTLENQIHNYLMPLADGRLLAYGNGGFAGAFNIEVVSVDDLATREVLVNFDDVTTDFTMYASMAVELEGGIVRVSGEALDFDSATPYNAFVFDFDLNSNALMEDSFKTFPMENSSTENIGILAGFSADGTVLAQYVHGEFEENGDLKGQLAFYEVATGETFVLDTPHVVFSQFQ